MELQNSAGFENSPGEAQIRFRRRRVTGGVIMHQDEGLGGEHNRRLKHFAGMGERLVDTASANGGDLDSFTVMSQVQHVEKLLGDYHIDIIPTLVVAGRYKIGPVNNGPDGMATVLDYLVKQVQDKKL